MFWPFDLFLVEMNSDLATALIIFSVPSKSNFVVVVVILITVTVHVHTCILTNLTRLKDVYELGWLEVSFNTTSKHTTPACIVSYPDRLKGGLGWILLHALTAYVSISAHFFYSQS